MHGFAVVGGGPVGVDGQLLPASQAVRVAVFALDRPGEQDAVALADLDGLRRHQRPLDRAGEQRDDAGDPVGLPHADDLQRHVGVAREEAGPVTRAEGGAVDGEQSRRAGDVVLVQERGDRLVGGAARMARTAADEDGELDRAALAQLAAGSVDEQAGPCEA